MKVYQSLPDGYVESNEHVVLKCEKDWIRITQVLGIFFIVFIIGFIIDSLFHLSDWDKEITGLAVTIFLCLIQRYPHELIHKGAAILLGSQRVQCSFEFGNPYAGSKDEYFDKGAYRVFALAPVILISLCCLGAWTFLLRRFFVYIWLFFSYQVATSSNDIFSARKVRKISEDILILDTGKETTVYVKKTDKKE